MSQPPSAPPPKYPPPAAPPFAAPVRKSKSGEKDSSVKETLESILVAFILAFIFRAFVVEAFVIPTGSMAPTLLGAHMRLKCNDCGYRFTGNYSPDPTGTDDLYIPPRSAKTHRAYCPNCGFKILPTDPEDRENRAHQPLVHYGDRILVLKYLYLMEEPQRWDVVVFKSPDIRQPGDEGYSAKASTYQQNYIKRLVGRPNESVLILDGDVFIGQPGQEVEQYTVQTKPPFVQDALWRVIYDNDFVPQGTVRADGTNWRNPWTVRDGSGWQLRDAAGQGRRVLQFDNAGGESTIYFDRTVNPIAEAGQSTPQPHAFTDWLAYDVDVPTPRNIVRDLKLSFVYARTAGEGPLRAKLTHGDHQFVAVISPSDARLLHVTKAGEAKQVGEAFKLPSRGEPVRVELTNVDHQVTLRIEGKVAAQTTPAEFRPDVKQLLEMYRLERQPDAPTVEITAANQTAAVSHLGLWRDIYYINKRIPNLGGGDLRWATPRKLPDTIMHLGADEFFVLGDNSLISGDARYWQVPIDLPADRLQVQAGRVPGRFMLGRAFFVYWPAGFKPASNLPGIAPNFGEMRYIR